MEHELTLFNRRPSSSKAWVSALARVPTTQSHFSPLEWWASSCSSPQSPPSCTSTDLAENRFSSSAALAWPSPTSSLLVSLPLMEQIGKPPLRPMMAPNLIKALDGLLLSLSGFMPFTLVIRKCSFCIRSTCMANIVSDGAPLPGSSSQRSSPSACVQRVFHWVVLPTGSTT
jgi:hypothetical protein